MNNSFSDLERLELIAQRLYERNVDLTASYGDWVRVTMACASLGEQARESYHKICSLYPKYRREEADGKFNNCLRTANGSVSLGTLVQMAKDAGVDTSMPRGRRANKAEDTDSKADKVTRIIDELTRNREWRYNVLREKTEFKEEGQDWEPMNDRNFDTMITNLRQQGLSIQGQSLKSILGSKDFARDYNPVHEYLNSLPGYDPEKDSDYIHETFVGHFILENPEDAPFYDMVFRHFIVGMVELWLGQIKENPTMPVLSGPQGIGKSYFCRGLLPPELESYVANVGPGQPIDKDTIIMLSEELLIVCDEFELSSKSKIDMYKYIASLDKSKVRRSYDRYSEDRIRRASLIGSNNQSSFIYEPEGNRRFVGVGIKGLIKLSEKPIDYRGLYAQVLYLITQNYPPHPSEEEISQINLHNVAYLQLDDCTEALLTIIRLPKEEEPSEWVLIGDLMKKLAMNGFRGSSFSAIKIGRSLRKMGFNVQKSMYGSKAQVVLLDPRQKAQSYTDTPLAQQKAPETTPSSPDAQELDLPF